MLSKSKTILSSHRDAATRVSTYLEEAHGIKLKPIVALEVIARALGAANWQTLSAMADQGRTPRPGDAVVMAGNPSDLPPIGRGSPLRDLLSKDGSPISETLQAILRRPVPASTVRGDFRFDQSQPGSMRKETVREEIWLSLVSRCVDRKIPDVGDVEGAIDKAQTEMGLELSSTQRNAVHTALADPFCVITGESKTGKGIVAEAIVRAARVAGLGRVLNTVCPDVSRIGSIEYPIGPDNFKELLSPVVEPRADGAPASALLTCDLLILDERALPNRYVFCNILRTVPAGCRIVLLGDIQLKTESVTNTVINELLNRKHARHIHLFERMRQIANIEFLTREGVSPAREERELNDGPGLPRDAYHMNGFFENGALPPTQSHHVKTYIYEAPAFQTTDRTGKWCIFRDEATVDAMWAKIQQAVVNKVLPAGLVSSPAIAKCHKGTYLICVFTHEWRDQADVMHVREILRGMGVEEELGYKRDLDTAEGVHGTAEEWFYRA